ncbi:hypothetical protein BST63_12350 [Bradyrhizobium canariense]|uniref:Uncharacterized protein n=2 Tax=Nitrobacteraceae TaxID=41294 RepID=A0ABX3X5L2_9BRAD|nr:hypothetical protein BST63_12350 [Bradyrhizobium canariense]
MLCSFNGSKQAKVTEPGFKVVCLLRFGHYGPKKRCFSPYLSNNFSGFFPTVETNPQLGRLTKMDRDEEKRKIKEQLATCRRLAAEFMDGVTAQNLEQLAAELEGRLEELARAGPGGRPRAD